MDGKVLFLKPYIWVFLIVCCALGVLFAFVVDANWGSVVMTKSGKELVLPNSRTILIFYCSVSYICLGVAYGLVDNRPKKDVLAFSLVFFWIQFFLVVLWLGIFFGLRLVGLGLLDIFGALVILGLTYNGFRTISLTAAGLLFPYAFLLVFLFFLNGYAFVL